eukprot:COSAG01_NODE_38065_length_494_cov_8.660759_2_plen_39_part_01
MHACPRGMFSQTPFTQSSTMMAIHFAHIDKAAAGGWRRR